MPKTKPFTRKLIKKQTLSEQVAAEIEASIINGSLNGGDALPTEPEISEQFGVSRAVVRDATRMLAAKGLVEAQHGKGVFVTHSPIAPFGDALMLALRRMDASNWDIIQFEQMLYPEVIALAAVNASAEDRHKIEATAAQYLEHHQSIADDEQFDGNSAEIIAFRQAWGQFIQSVFDATHNAVISLLALPLLRVRNINRYINLPDTHTRYETELIDAVVALIKAGDPDEARRKTADLLTLRPEAVQAFMQTPIGEVTTIVLD